MFLGLKKQVNLRLGNDLFSYKNEYGSAWKNLVPKGQKVMVIYCGYATKYHAVGDNVRNFDKNNNGEFPILDGLECTDNNAIIYWMEV